MRGATLRQLRAFSAVARHRSFLRAATELHVTPSAVSLQVKELEQTVGLALFGRAGRSACLTRVGELLLADVNRAFLALQDAEDSLNRLRGKETGVVAVGMVTNANYFMPRLLAGFHIHHPNIELHVSVVNRESLLKQLANNEVDFAIMGQPPGNMDARFEMLAAQSLGIVAAPEHPLAGDLSIPAIALEDYEFIVREMGSGTRRTMDRFFCDAGITPPQLLEMANNDSIKQAVIANMGLAFVSLHAAALEIQSSMLVILDVVGLPINRSWYLVTGKSETLCAAADALRRYIIDWAKVSPLHPMTEEYSPTIEITKTFTGSDAGISVPVG